MERQRMTTTFWTMGAAAVALLVTLYAPSVLAAQSSLEAAFRVATETETVKGDLTSAIEQYRTIADSGDRALAARALVRMAQCHQKLGDGQARAVYERVVRDYGDQNDAAAFARSQLAANEPQRMLSRRVASVPVGGIGYGSVSPDGRYFPYTNWTNGDLYLRDLLTGDTRRLTNVAGLNDDTSQFATQSTFSKDGRYLAYSWAIERQAEVRVVPVAGTNASPRRIYGNADLTAIWPDDWSSDGKWLAVQLRRADKTTQIALLSVDDGVLRVLKSIDWRGATRLLFSPDARYVAYDLPVSERDNQRDIFVLAVDGAREMTVSSHPANEVVMGWSPDGSAVLFSSDRSGAVGLWQQRFANGNPHAAAELLKSNIEGAPLGITAKGALYSLVHHPRFNSAISADIRVATLDFDTGKLTSPLSPVHRFVGSNNFPVWSADGKLLAYVSLREGPTDPAAGSRNRFIIGIYSADTGTVRELHPNITLYPPAVRWSADGRSLLTHGRDLKGRQGLYRIDAQSGDVSTIALAPDDGELRNPSESPDGQRLYYMRGYVGQPERSFVLMERDARNGTERELIRARSIFAPSAAQILSPNGEWVSLTTLDPGTQASALQVAEVKGGPAKEILRIDAPRRVAFQAWTPDGRAVLARVSTVSGATPAGLESPAELWRVPLDGSEPRKLDLSLAGMTHFSVHPDGRRIAYGVIERAKDDEVWVLENFLKK